MSPLVALAAALCWVAGACALVPSGPTVGGSPSAASIVELLASRRAAFGAVAMQGQVLVEESTGTTSAQHFILARAPDKLRVQLVGMGGRPVMLLACSGTRMVVVDYPRAVAYVGRATRAMVGRFLGVGLTPREAYALLVGAVPTLEGHVEMRVRRAGQGRWLLRLVRGQVVEELMVELGRGVVHAAWITAPGVGQLSCTYSNFVRTPAGWIAKNISFSQGQRRLEIYNSRVVANPTLQPRVFSPRLPPGLKVVHVQ